MGQFTVVRKPVCLSAPSLILPSPARYILTSFLLFLISYGAWAFNYNSQSIWMGLVFCVGASQLRFQKVSDIKSLSFLSLSPKIFVFFRPDIFKRWSMGVLARYVIWGALFSAAYSILSTHPYYQTNESALTFIRWAMQGYWITGIPYFGLSLFLFPQTHQDLALRYLAILRSFIRFLFHLKQKRIRFNLRRRKFRTTLSMLFLRLYFFPVMIGQMEANL